MKSDEIKIQEVIAVLNDAEAYDYFKHVVRTLFGRRLQQSEDDARAFWGALANVQWSNPGFDEVVHFSYRAAGRLVSEITGRGDYMSYYCSAPDGIVPEWVARELDYYDWSYSARPSSGRSGGGSQ